MVFEIIVAILVGGYTITQVQQLSVSRDSEKRQLRAYLSLPSETLGSSGINSSTNRLVIFAESKKAKAQIAVENAGQTPAYDIKTRLGITVAPRPIPADFVFPARDTERAGMLNPHQHVFMLPTSLFDIALDDVLNVKNETKVVYVYGFIDYTDVWGAPHFIEVCLWYGVDKYTSTFCDTHNDADRN